jgi:hypothetical protein
MRVREPRQKRLCLEALQSGRAVRGGESHARTLADGVVASGVAVGGRATLGVEDKSDDETIETQHLGEDENQNHADEELPRE